MKEEFFMGAGIASFIMVVWMLLIPNTTVDYLQNLYHTDNIEIVWESKADSTCLYPSLEYYDNIDSVIYSVEDTPEYRAKIDSIVLDMQNQKAGANNCTQKIVRYKVEVNDTTYEDVRTFYYKDGKVIIDNISVRNRILQTFERLAKVRMQLDPNIEVKVEPAL